MRDLAVAAQVQGTGHQETSFQDEVTGFWVVEPFASFWKEKGGLAVFGRPISGMMGGGKEFTECEAVQWFERARFELHKGGVVMLGLVGSEARELVSTKVRR